MAVLLLICAAAVAYQILAIVAALRHMHRRQHGSDFAPGISVLKPVRGVDPGFREAIESHVRQQYPEFEILFGVSEADDPAAAEVERLREEHTGVPIRLIHCPTSAPNLKAGILAGLAREARHSILLVNDSDIVVPNRYLQRVVGPLGDAAIGLVTCLYRADSPFWPGKFEALGIATDFAPSVLVAPLTGVSEFALGSTMVFRAAELEKAGGFEAIADYLADDYELGRRISDAGLRIHLSDTVVETRLGGESWAEVWAHQVRWHRTIRVSKGWGYLGIPITFATVWAALALGAGAWWIAAPLLGLRMAAALVTGIGVLESRVVGRYWYWVPVRDLFGAAIWLAGLAGRSVEWRGRILRLSRDGRITSSAE